MPSQLLRIRATSPASVANLGSGYDCLALAVDLWNEYEIYAYTSALGGSQEFKFREPNFAGTYGSFPDSRMRTENGNKFIESFVHTRKYLCEKAERLVARCPCFVTQRVDIPPIRGLGSSSSASVAGTLAAFEFVARVYPDVDFQELLSNRAREDCQEFREIQASLVREIDRCPDNLCASLAGGLTYSFTEPTGVPLDEPRPLYFFRDKIIDDALRCVALIPAKELETNDARGVVDTQQYSARQVVFNLTRATCLPRVLRDMRYELLRKVTEDKIHQEQRIAKFYRTIEAGQEIDVPGVFEAVIAQGAYTAFISGAGSTLVALTDQSRAADVEIEFRRAFEGTATGWTVEDVRTLRPTNLPATCDSACIESVNEDVETWLKGLPKGAPPMETGDRLVARPGKAGARESAVAAGDVERAASPGGTSVSIGPYQPIHIGRADLVQINNSAVYNAININPESAPEVIAAELIAALNSDEASSRFVQAVAQAGEGAAVDAAALRHEVEKELKSADLSEPLLARLRRIATDLSVGAGGSLVATAIVEAIKTL